MIAVCSSNQPLVAMTALINGTFLQIRMINAERRLWGKHLLSIMLIERSDMLPVAFEAACARLCHFPERNAGNQSFTKTIISRGIHYRQ